MLEHYYAVIMAGGGGTRLWPLSRQTKPKQMLSIFGDRSLFQISVQRLQGLFPPERILVVTVASQAEELQAQAPEIPLENYLLEPLPRGTASVVGLAAVALQHRDPQATMAILTSDHFIGNEELFRRLLGAAYTVAQDGHLVTLGIEPSFPATGYGYIEQGLLIGAVEGQNVYQAVAFKEKPNEERARIFFEDGQHAWNSGMFIWRVDRILKEFARQMPQLYASLNEITAAWDTTEQSCVVERIWPSLHNETIDYGVMEGAENVAVIPAAGLGWSDVGSWDSLFDVLPQDLNGNILMGGNHIGLDTKDSLVYANQGQRLIVTIGVENLVLVDTGDVLLVCRTDQAQRVRQVVQQLKTDGQAFL